METNLKKTNGIVAKATEKILLYKTHIQLLRKKGVEEESTASHRDPNWHGRFGVRMFWGCSRIQRPFL